MSGEIPGRVLRRCLDCPGAPAPGVAPRARCCGAVAFDEIHREGLLRASAQRALERHVAALPTRQQRRAARRRLQRTGELY